MEPIETKELRSWEELKPNQEAVELFDDKEHVLEFLSDRVAFILIRIAIVL